MGPADMPNRSLGIYLIVLPLVLVLLLIGLWPSEILTGADAPDGTKVTVWQTVLCWKISPSIGMLLIVAVAGALGGSLNASYKFAVHNGLGQFKDDWYWWYVMHPMFGMGLGLVVYLLFKGGLFAVNTGGGGNSIVDPAGFAALSALVGMFARKGFAKLDEIFDTLLKAPKVQEEIEARPPVIDSVEPATKKMNDPDLNIRVKGRNFVENATVEIGGKSVDHKVVADGVLDVALTVEQLSVAGKLAVVVINPAGGGRSKPVEVEVTDA